ncbi:flagellar basal-body MS-ring/collar protein FliF [Burkholderia ambifaria]|uniref:flagellar basal-body MS-ring/collar protein FliF n=1 Tax=Burkholderia ambifaria TaxID=152480 RepID=UPI00158B8895|nr:flagellar basal-body MS-ring/collar protein FliF [Burkholderia ambifaria]
MNDLLSRLRTAFTNASPGRQAAWVVAFVAVIALLIGSGYAVLRPHYRVLFQDLKPQDASTIIAELERQKVPFRIDETSNAILVPEGDSRATRLKLMSSDLHLQGTVGFELFNNADLGLTDFAQKVNYQRALQGELARTIMSLDEIDMARVHLTLPESSLFRRSDDRPKASVALFVRDGKTLSPTTIRGVQRLIAAAVPQMAVADVTVVDQRGDPVNARDSEIDDPRYALKRSVEREYERKIASQIAPLLPKLHATVAVDATLNFDQIRVTNEFGTSQPLSGHSDTMPPLPPIGPRDKRQSAPPGPPPLPVAMPSDGTRTERKLEQIVSAPGSLKRLSVGIVVDGPLSESTQAQLKAVAAAAIGVTPSRGDQVSIFAGQTSGAQSSSRVATPVPIAPPTATRPTHDKSLSVNADALARWEIAARRVWRAARLLRPLLGYAAVVILLTGLAFAIVHRARAGRRHPRTLTDTERDEYVARLRALLADTRGRREHA